MAAPFFFALEFSSQGVPPGLLAELASQVLAHVGVSEALVAGTIQSIERALAQGPPQARCDVRFLRQAAALEVVVSANGGRLWQAALPIG